ncbi:hypothetical protein DSCA_11960 [Desulfosarcina alkanivorans]|uniref:Uncharacterized protein n=1 Tax=Desulfosarcina alkanivorans TaxID=571177 RepID=A0A5K7YE28_9BACT|nr:hypothetical protein DSCA_11960 [Desulfosarcina alkanivorans]
MLMKLNKKNTNIAGIKCIFIDIAAIEIKITKINAKIILL